MEHFLIQLGTPTNESRLHLLDQSTYLLSIVDSVKGWDDNCPRHTDGVEYLCNLGENIIEGAMMKDSLFTRRNRSGNG